VRGNAADADTVLTRAARAELAAGRDGDEHAGTGASVADSGTRIPPSTPRYRIAGGETGDVSIPVLIGRSPSAPRMATERIALVRVDSPGGVVSATHLELRMEGGRLIAADLRSTNGTVVRTAAGTRRLRSGESLVVSPGTSLQLGGDTIVEILPALGSVDA
jgi:pSer/pThr/pTyr-binding forkhead associated (FHA) protein